MYFPFDVGLNPEGYCGGVFCFVYNSKCQFITFS